jgi:hypothetical protein
VEIVFDDTGAMHVQGNRDDLQQIEKLIADNRALADSLRTVNALSSHLANISLGSGMSAEFNQAPAMRNEVESCSAIKR